MIKQKMIAVTNKKIIIKTTTKTTAPKDKETWILILSFNKNKKLNKKMRAFYCNQKNKNY